ncbi:MAG: hypothetical protein K2N38_13120 [Oscillospiraceae bacterium]|nr:hypothetical protein [Oscillospiraceae bacterium]
MAKKNRKITPREKHSEDVINELFGSTESEPDIESDIADLGNVPDDDMKIARDPRKHKFFFGFAVFVVIMAVIGCIASVRAVSGVVRDIMSNTSLKTEFTRFLLPVVANDVAPFENESEISNSAKVSCSIWNILVNKDITAYPKGDTGDYNIPEYDISVSCKELFGTGSTLTHQTVGSGDSRFYYDEANHMYNCPSNMRYLNYSPRIVGMTEDHGTYVLTVEYLPPSFTMAIEDMDFEVTADKTMEYTINRWDKKNTIMSVRFIEGHKL